MLVLFRLQPPESNLWYLAYGSNLSSSKFIHDRGIVPLNTAIVTVPGFTLTMNSAGFPYSEPAFASVSSIHLSGNEKSVQLIGTAYLLTRDMYSRVLASEGGGIAYAEIELRAEEVAEKDVEKRSGLITTRSLVTVLERKAKPSLRYMELLRNGAHEARMPLAYQEYLANISTYQPPQRHWQKMGAILFLSFWVPVMSLMEKITKASLSDGRSNAPTWIVILVRVMMYTMWFYHDYIHAPIWGRGDGMDVGATHVFSVYINY